MNVDGTGVQRLTNNTNEDLYPTWSPDGELIAFQSDRDGDFDIYVTNSDGSGREQRVTDNRVEDWGPVWMPEQT